VTWYYAPFISAPATEDSSLPSEVLPAPWLTLSGTPTQRPLSWRGWQRRDWIKLLSGTISRPLMAGLGADVWISSLPVSLVSPSRQRGSGWGLTMTVGSGHKLSGSSMRFDPASCSWKTCQALFEQDYPQSSMTLPNSGSMRSGVCSLRPTLGQPIAERGCGLWPSPLARDSKGQGFDNTNLPNAVRMWTDTDSHHAPTTSTGGGSGMVLNPRFVEALMGLPNGWLTPSILVETASSPSAPALHGTYSQSGVAGD
jgi:hypothetical protein